MQWNEFTSHIGYLPVRDQKRVEGAFELGKKLHEGQKRKSGEPYFTHPIAVAHILADMGADADTLIAALLHDTVEDTDITLEEIDKAFNGSVTTLIDGVTKIFPEEVAEKPTLDDQIESLRKIFELMQRDIRIIVIKLIDRLHNMQTVGFMSEERQKTYADETADVFVKIADRLSMGDVRDALGGLCIEVLDAPLYQRLLQLRLQNEKLGIALAKSMESDVSQEGKIRVRCLFEFKSWEKLKLQLETEGKYITGVSTQNIAFVCDSIPHCYTVLGALHQLWQREHLSFQDFINSPKLNGYQGLHTTVILKDGTRVRCKIRTRAMQEYAHNGITVQCFKNGEKGVQEHLPWVQRITPLSQDTADRSASFWESLQNDILGESIIVHGSGDNTFLVPKKATALDGAFYCFPHIAGRTTEIRVNGQTVPFSSPLPNGASLQIEYGKRETINREWLEFVQTGFAVAKIRTALASRSDKQKIISGKTLLQEFLREKKSGFIEEFNEGNLLPALQMVGCNSLDDAYRAIADGHVEAEEVYRAIFEHVPGAGRKSAQHTVRYEVDPDDVDKMKRITEIHKHYRNAFDDVRYHYLPRQKKGIFSITAHLAPDRLRSFTTELSGAGVWNLSMTTKMEKIRFSLGVVFLLIVWGFDPAVGHFLIKRYAIAPVDMTLVRFWSLTAISAAWLLWRHLKYKRQEAPLSIFNKSLWISVALMIAIAYTTYVSLLETQPVQYSIPMTAGGVLLTSIVNRKRIFTLLATWLLIIAGTLAIIAGNPDWSFTSIVYTLAAVASFSLFSIVSERYKREQHVAARSAQYFFLLSVFCAILTLPLLPYATFQQIQAPVMAYMVGFSILFAGLPYYIYYELLSHKQIDYVLRYSFIIIYTTWLGQMILSPWTNIRETFMVTLLGAVLVTTGAVLPILSKYIRRAS